MPLPWRRAQSLSSYQLQEPADTRRSLLPTQLTNSNSSNIQLTGVQELRETKLDEQTVKVEQPKGRRKSRRSTIFRSVKDKLIDTAEMKELFLRLLESAADDDVQEVERLVKKTPSLMKERDEHGATVLHHAVKHGSTQTLQTLTKKDNALDAVNDKGQTLYHIAVEFLQTKVLKILADTKCNPNCVNNVGKAPLHIVVEENNIDLLETLLEDKKVDANVRDTTGGTALHICAFLDHSECAAILLDHGAKLCAKCNNGFYPLHLAAQGGKRKTLEIFITHAEAAGYKRENILKFTDSSNNMPLHAAVLSGNVEAVKACLSGGAQIDAAQADQQTPVHLAAGQGALDLIQIMFDEQPDSIKSVLEKQDLADMTPLHKAAMFDRANVAEYIIEKGSELNVRDCMERSPILVAAERKSWSTIKVLIQKCADITLRDRHQSNVLHLIIKNGGKPEQFKGCFCKCREVIEGSLCSCKVPEESTRLLNEADQYGCTPLHYACKGGMVSTITKLLELGASVSARTKLKESPLHFAAKYGRYNTCIRLLDGASDSSTINESDDNGCSPLLLAASNGHCRVVQMLLQRGAAAVHRNFEGDTCLHLAAANGYTDTMSIIYSCNSSLLDSQNKHQDTPLHVAALNGKQRAVGLLLTLGAKLTKDNDDQTFLDIAIERYHKDVCATVVSHDRWKEVLEIGSSVYGCPVLGLIKHLPEVCEMVLDRSKTVSQICDSKSPEYSYTYDFHFLQLPMDKIRKLREAGEDHLPLVALNKMVDFGRVNCLRHPVSREYLLMKWRAYGMWFYMVNLVLYLLFLISLTIFTTVYPSTLHDDFYQTNDSNNSDPQVEPVTNKFQLKSSHSILVIIIMTFCVLNILKEILQMIQQRIKYFLDVNNLLEWVLYITSAVFISPFIVNISTHIQWQCGAIAVFLAWFNLMLFLQRLDFFGIYVVMFQQILKTLLQVLVVFFILIVAFGLALYIIMAGKGAIAFNTPAISLVTAGVMMLGSVDYLEGWVIPYTDNDPTTLHFSTLSFVILVVFILIMPILLMNLLIGLAVGDIEAVQRDAKLKRIAMQVALHTEIERKIPQRILEYVDKSYITIYPNAPCGKSRIARLMHRIKKSADFSNSDHGQDDNYTSQDYVYEQLHKQKYRLKQISSNLDKQYELIRLIVQKMEIQSEADDADEGDSTNQDSDRSRKRATIGWSSPAIRRTLMQQISVLPRK